MWEEIRTMWPWPAQSPNAPAPTNKGWLSDGTKEMLATYLCDNTEILEIGTWAGLSARWMLRRYRRAWLVSIDHYKGSKELSIGKYRHDLEQLRDIALSQCWAYRTRLVLAEGTSVETMCLLAEADWRPHLVYVDGSHEKPAVYADVMTAARLFPGAQLVGDDWDGYEVRPGVEAAAAELGVVVENNGKAWHIGPQA